VPVPNVQWITPDDGQRNCPKHVEFRTRINLEISASVGFNVKKFITMHGHMNIYLPPSSLGPVGAETRVQSGDWYGSGTLHPGQVLRCSLPLLFPAF